MDFISDSWFNELGMDEPFFLHPCENMDTFDEELAAACGEDFSNCLSNSKSNTTNNSNSCSSDLLQRSDSWSTLCASPATVLEAPSRTFPAVTQTQPAERPAKQRRSNGRTAAAMPAPDHPTSAPIILNFSNSASSSWKSRGQKRTLNPVDEAELFLNNEEEVITPPPVKPEAPLKKTASRVRPSSQTYDHAERKRREQLSQLFVALSTMVPGLKKMDKTSVLGDAITYLKQLQERVNILEEQTTKQNMESVVLVRKSQLLVNDVDGDEDEGEGEGSSDENPLGNSHGSLPEIEARVSDKNVLIRIHCEKNKGVLVNILAEIEKLKLLVTNTSVVSLGRLAFEITITAEMETDFHSTTKGIVRTLRAALE